MSILSIVLSIIVAALLLKIYNFKRAIRSISKELDDILKEETNMLVVSETNDKDIREFTRELNKRLKILRKLNLEYRNGNRELRESITNISHDIRTPLTAIRGYLDLLEEENKLNKKYLKIINSKILEMQSLTDELYDYTFCLDRYAEIEKSEVVVNEILEEVIVSFYGAFKRVGIDPVVQIDSEKIVKKLNRAVLYRIFENILSNSLKYSEGDLKISLLADGSIIFSNKTSKISRVSLANIFDRFYTIEDNKTKSGIGLAIAKQLVEISDGEIEASIKDDELSIIVKFK